MTGSENHVTESKSNKVMRWLLDDERFVPRELSERDYGIDLMIECFNPGRVPTGRHLMVQLKGEDVAAPADGAAIGFTTDVKHLLAAELFAVPVLLIWVPTAADSAQAWYVWIQEYIDVVLDHGDRNAGWRSQKYKTLHLPVDNRLHDPGAPARLMDVAATPSRNKALLQLAGIAYDALWHQHDHQRRADLLREALTLPALGDDDWQLGAKVRSAIETALADHEADVEAPNMTINEAFAYMNTAAWSARNADVRHFLWENEAGPVNPGETDSFGI